jgi:hypothetical protein
VSSVSSSVGKIILLWGAVESQLNGLTQILIHPLNDPPKNKGVPNPFSQRIKLLRRCYEANSRMASIADEAVGVLMGLTPLHERRSIIVHGDYQGVGPDSRHMFVIYRASRTERHGWRWEYFTAEELTELAKEITSAQRKVQDIAKRTHRLSAQQSD